MKRTELLNYLDELLQPWLQKDYAPNGLQVEGSAEVKTIVTAVTADINAINRAVALNADCLLVHHGYFWKNEPEVITGMKQRRLKLLLGNDINLVGYHLPLDVHQELGNNVQLGKLLQVENIRQLHPGSDNDIVLRGELAEPMKAADLGALLTERLGQKPVHIAGHERPIKSVAWCTGGAQDYIDEVARFGIDAFISGEISERTYHSAVEQGIDYFAAGHHATERGGVRALGQHLAKRFGLTVEFIDTPNPV